MNSKTFLRVLIAFVSFNLIAETAQACGVLPSEESAVLVERLDGRERDNLDAREIERDSNGLRRRFSRRYGRKTSHEGVEGAFSFGNIGTRGGRREQNLGESVLFGAASIVSPIFILGMGMDVGTTRLTAPVYFHPGKTKDELRTIQCEELSQCIPRLEAQAEYYEPAVSVLQVTNDRFARECTVE